MKRHLLLLLILCLSAASGVNGQASTSSDFKFAFDLPTYNHSYRFKVFYAPRNGHEFNRIEAGMSVVHHTLLISGHSSYVVGVPFPELLIEEEIYSSGNFEKRNYYLVKFSSQGVENNEYPFIQLNPAYKKQMLEVGEAYQGRVEVEVSSCSHADCGNLYHSLTSQGKPWQAVDVENLDHQYKRMITGPDLPAFIINGANRPYTTEMKLFTQKYQIDFDYQNVTADSETIQRTLIHNRNLATQLNQQYGAQWKKEIKVSVFGL